MFSTRDSKNSCSETCIFLRNKNQHDAGHRFYNRINDKCIVERKNKSNYENGRPPEVLLLLRLNFQRDNIMR